MAQDFIIEFDYFKNRKYVFILLDRIAKEFSNQKLTGYQVFINNIPSSLEFYVYLCFDVQAEEELSRMKNMLFPIGIYRPDLSLDLLFDRMGERGFDSFSITSFMSTLILENAFLYDNPNQVPRKESFLVEHIKQLQKKGYNAFEKLKGGTTLFISHSSKQKKQMEKIMPYFNADNELIWLDKYRIERSKNEKHVKRQIAEGLNLANKVLFYITSDFLESEWCKYELYISKKIYDEKNDYKLLFIIDETIESEFFKQYESIMDNIDKDSILIINEGARLEAVIEKFITKRDSAI